MQSTPQIVDSHCHLDFPNFEGELDDIVNRAHEAGVTRMVTICTKLKNEPAVRAIAESHESVFYAAGNGFEAGFLELFVEFSQCILPFCVIREIVQKPG